MSNNVEDILAYAWSKDAVNLKSALGQEMNARISDQLDNMYSDVAASMFSATSGEQETNTPPVEEIPAEGLSNENV